MGRSMEDDLRLGQIAVRMGLLRAQDLPDLIQEARTGHVEESAGSGSAFAQLLLRKRLLSVSDYLYMASQARAEATHHDSDPMNQVGAAFRSYESGELDMSSFEEIVARSGEPIVRPAGKAERFGNYELLGEIARGGMGIVYKARDQRNSRILALKVMIECDDDEVRLQRFQLEAELCASLDHPNVVRIHDAGRIEGMPFFTMDLVEGDSLDDLLEGKGVARDLALKVIAQAARAMDHAHERGIIHRDLKPGNILIERTTNAGKVTDFGLARDLHRGTRLTQVGQAVGTPYYMAPEQVRGERDVDGRCDIYALGVILYEILTGDVPFDADSPLSLFRKIDREEIKLELDPSKGIDERIHAITLRALAKEREERYHRASYFADDLERYLRGEEPRAKPYDWRERLTQSFRGRGRGALVGGLALVTFVILSVAVALTVRRVRTAQAREAARGQVVAGLEAAQASLEAARGTQGQAASQAAAEGITALDAVEALLAVEGPAGEEAREAFEAEGGPRLRLELARSAAAAEARAAMSLDDLARARQALQRVLSLEPEERPLRVLFAQLEARAGHFEAALELLEQVLTMDGSDSAGRLARGRLLIELDRADEGLRDLSALLLQRPGDASARAERAVACLALGRVRDARFEAEQACALAPDDPAGQLAMGDVARAEGHRAEAEAAYAEARRLAPRDPRPLLRSGRLYAAEGSYELARASFDAAAKLGDVEGQVGAALADASLFRLAEAEARLRAALEESKRLPGLEQGPARAALRIAAAEVALAADGPDAARAWLEEASQETPRSREVAVWLARWYLLRGDAKRAEAALTSFPGSAGPALLSIRSQVARELGREALARTLAEQALARSPAGQAHARARRALAQILIRQDQEGAARRACASAWDASWEDADLAGRLLHEGLELAALRLEFGSGGAPDRAEEYLRAVIRIDPERAPAYWGLARLALAERRYVQARRFASRSLELDPYRPELAEVACEVALGPERPEPAAIEEALLSLDRALADAPSAQRLLLRARALLRLARYAEASDTLDRVGKLLPTRAEVEGLRAEALRGRGEEAGARLAEERYATLGTGRRREREECLEQAEGLKASDPPHARALLDGALRRADFRVDQDLGPLALLRAELASERIDALATLAPLLLHQPRWQTLDQADRVLGGAWWSEPLSSEDWEALRRRSAEGEPAALLEVAVAALYDAATGRASPLAVGEGLSAAERVLASAPACAMAQVARAYLRAHHGDPLRALRELQRLESACGDSALFQLATAEAAAAAGRADLSRAALERSASRKLIELEARCARSKFLSKL